MLILVIDRNDAVAAAMGDYLEHAGDQVDFAADGTTALRLAQTRPYDVYRGGRGRIRPRWLARNAPATRPGLG